MSMVMLIAPLSAYGMASFNEVVPNSCHVVEKNSKAEKSCHSEQDHPQHPCKGDCKSHDCCTHISMIKNFVVQSKHTVKEEFTFFIDKSINASYNSLNYKLLTFSFWHPPKQWV